MTKKEKVLEIQKIFDEVYKDAKCSLDYSTPLELLIAVMLSAQCTDARVNLVTPKLFERYKNAEDFALADVLELMEIIKPCGFYKTKARNIISASTDILNKYEGVVPDTMEKLLSLAGVGRKTANLVLGDIYGIPGLVIDTHAIRLTNRLGLTDLKDPQKIEYALNKIVPDDYKIRFCHQLVYHGRAICNARNPKCLVCPVRHLCKFGQKIKQG